MGTNNLKSSSIGIILLTYSKSHQSAVISGEIVLASWLKIPSISFIDFFESFLIEISLWVFDSMPWGRTSINVSQDFFGIIIRLFNSKIFLHLVWIFLKIVLSLFDFSILLFLLMRRIINFIKKDLSFFG